jgi:hypothetical protein
MFVVVLAAKLVGALESLLVDVFRIVQGIEIQAYLALRDFIWRKG